MRECVFYNQVHSGFSKLRKGILENEAKVREEELEGEGKRLFFYSRLKLVELQSRMTDSMLAFKEV